jgi:hypothetical protein
MQLTKPLRAQPLQQAAGTGTLDTSGGGGGGGGGGSAAATAAGAAAAAHPFSEFSSTSGLVRELSLNSNYSLLAKQVMYAIFSFLFPLLFFDSSIQR